MTGKQRVQTLSFESDFDAAQPTTTYVHFQTSDNVTYAVRDTALSPSAYMSSLVYGARRHRYSSNDDPLCLSVPSVKSDVFRTLLEYCYFHTSFLKSTLSDQEVKAWDEDLLNVDQAVLCSLAEGAYVLKISSLLDQACRAISNLISGKSTEEIQRTFHLEPDTFVPHSKVTKLTSASNDTYDEANSSMKRKKKMRNSRIRRRKIRDESEDDSSHSAGPALLLPASQTNIKSAPPIPSIPLNIRIRPAHTAKPKTIPSDPSSEDIFFDNDGSHLTTSIQNPRSLPRQSYQPSIKTDHALLDIPQNSQKRSREFCEADKTLAQQDSSSESEVQFISMTLSGDKVLKTRDVRSSSLDEEYGIRAKNRIAKQTEKRVLPRVVDEVVVEANVSPLATRASTIRSPTESVNVQIARLEERKQAHLDRASQIDTQISQLTMEREKIRDLLAVVTVNLSELRKQTQSQST